MSGKSKEGVHISLLDKSKYLWIFLRRLTAKQLINIKNIQDCSIELENGDTLLFYRVQPVNINTLPESIIAERINSFMNVLKTMKEIEISCFNTAENYSAIQEYLKGRMEEETETKINKLLRKDIEHLDKIRRELATAKEFLITVRFNSKEKEQAPISAGRIEKVLKEYGLCPKLLKKEDLKHMLAVYFEQDTTWQHREDFSGEGRK